MQLKPDDIVKIVGDDELIKVSFINHEERTFLSEISKGEEFYQSLKFDDIEKVYREENIELFKHLFKDGI